jgi:hypothetical protein
MSTRVASLVATVRRTNFAVRAAMCLVLLLGFASFVCTAVASAFAVRTGDMCEKAAQAWSDTEEGAKLAESFDNAAHAEFAVAYVALSAQNICEMVGCLLVACAFMYLVPSSLALMRKALVTLRAKIRLIPVSGGNQQLPPRESADGDNTPLADLNSPEAMARHMVTRAMQKNEALRRQLVVTNSIVLMAFLPRCVFVVFVAVSNFNNKANESCALCGPCQTIGRQLTEYLYVRPELYSGIAWLSSALPMAVCLWGMLSGADRRTLRFNLPVKDKSLEGGANMVSARLNISLPL